jgi:hypothetical protein
MLLVILTKIGYLEKNVKYSTIAIKKDSETAKKIWNGLQKML